MRMFEAPRIRGGYLDRWWIKNPCEVEPGVFEHELEFVDDSFDHDLGVEIIHYWRCAVCGHVEAADYYDDDHGYY